VHDCNVGVGFPPVMATANDPVLPALTDSVEGDMTMLTGGVTGGVTGRVTMPSPPPQAVRDAATGPISRANVRRNDERNIEICGVRWCDPGVDYGPVRHSTTRKCIRTGRLSITSRDRDSLAGLHLAHEPAGERRTSSTARVPDCRSKCRHYAGVRTITPITMKNRMTVGTSLIHRQAFSLRKKSFARKRLRV